MPTNNYTFTGYADNTDVGSVTDWERVFGTSGWATAMADGEVDFNTTDATGAGYAVNTGQTDHTIKMTYGSGKAGGNFFPVAVRVASSGNYIGARISSGQLQLVKCVSGTLTQVGTNVAVSQADTTTLALEAVGTSIKVYRNDALLITETITEHSTATKCGFVARSAAAAGLITSVDVTYTASGLTITSVNTTNTAFSAQTDSAVVGTGLSASVVCTYAGIACTNESASSSTSLKITFPNFFTNNIKLGRNYEFKAVG